MDSVSSIQNKENREIKKLSWNDINNVIDLLMLKIENEKYTNIYGLPRGGLIPAVIFSHRLNIPLILNKKQIKKTTLIVDDIVDSGNTLFDLTQEFSDSTIIALIYNPNQLMAPSFYGIKNADKLWIKFPWEVE